MNSASRLISLDVDARFQEVAREAFLKDERLTLIVEDAISFLQRQETASFDFVFAGAMDGKYEGLEEALRVVKAGGFYVIDDMLPQANWPDGHALKVEALLSDLSARADLEISPMAWASGIVVAAKQ
jgi:predicted O-methyltransferase YrrM